MTLEEKIKQLPLKAGVYLWKNKNDKIIYVGKAIKLRNRVRSYLQDNRPRDAKTKALVLHIRDVEVIVTDTEAEALILEDTLIKKYKPKYNVLLRDDKTYPYVRVTNELYPKIFQTRTVIKDGSKYFGPFTDLTALNTILKTLRTLFRLRSCNYNITDESISRKKYKICLDFHIKKCDGPCEGRVTADEYGENIKKSMKILTGKTKEVENQLELEMIAASDNLEFEKATFLRNKLALLRDYSSKQKVVSSKMIDRDVFAITRFEDLACSLIFKIREGKLIGKRHYIIKNLENQSDSDIVSRTIQRWYLETDFIPKEIFLPCEANDMEYLISWLGEKKGKSVNIKIPKIGENKELVEMATTNGKFILKEYKLAYSKREQVIPRAVQSLQRDLRLAKLPRVIECFDNSHIQGSELVSSMVHFVDGKPKKSEYRKYKNRTVQSNDDFAAMQEVIYRRYSRLKDEIDDERKQIALGKIEVDAVKLKKLPDMVVIDGGKGQLSSACEILENLGLTDKIVVIGLAKRLEEVFVPNDSDAILLPKTSSSLRLLQHLRDEAHRFAITYHRDLRSKRTLKSVLTEIPSIGEKTSKKLLIKLGSIENIKKANEATLGLYLNKKQINNLIEYFK